MQKQTKNNIKIGITETVYKVKKNCFLLKNEIVKNYTLFKLEI